MGICSSHGGSPAAVFMTLATGREKFSREQIHMIDAYLPDFRVHEPSTEQHRQIAARHWDAVFKEKRTSLPRASKTYSTHTTHIDSERSSIHDGSEHRSTATMSTTQSGSKIGELYDAFYSYLDQHAPELKPLFRSSLHVKGKVLVHISAGMRSILASDRIEEKIAALTKTHVRFGVQLEHFNPLGMALLSAMATVSEGAWTPDIADAWRRLFAHCSAMLMVQQKKMGKGQMRHVSVTQIPQ